MDAGSGKGEMIFSKSITFDQEELNGVSLAAEESRQSTAEARFIEKLKNGDEMAFHRLVELYGNHVYSLLLTKTGDPEEAKDLAQETFLRAYTRLTTFREGARFSTWLYTIALNVTRSELRKRKARKNRPPLSLDAARNEDGRGTEPPDEAE